MITFPIINLLNKTFFVHVIFPSEKCFTEDILGCFPFHLFKLHFYKGMSIFIKSLKCDGIDNFGQTLDL